MQVSVVVAIQRVGAVAKGYKEIEIIVAVDIHPYGLPHRSGIERKSGCGGDVAESRPVVAVQREHRTGTGGEAHEQVGVTVAIPVAKRGRPRGACVGDARTVRHVGEQARVIAIQTIGRAVEPHEQIEIAIAVDIGKRIHQAVGRGKQFRLDGLQGDG